MKFPPLNPPPTAMVSLFCFLSSATLAFGQSDAKSQARVHFERAIQFGEAGAFREAVVEFERAYQIAPHYAVLYNLGQAYVALAKPVEAVDTLQRYLADGGANVPMARRQDVLATIRGQQSRIGTVTIAGNVAGAAIALDGVVVGRSPLRAPVRLGGGKHEITAVLDGYWASPRVITLVGGQQMNVTLALERTPAGSADGVAGPVVPTAPGAAGAAVTGISATDPSAATPRPLTLSLAQDDRSGAADRRWHQTVGYAMGGVGLAAGGLALIHYRWNKRRYDAYQMEMRTDDAKAASIRNASILTATLAISSGVLLAAGIVLWVTAPPTSPAPGSSTSRVTAAAPGLLVGPNSIAWRVLW